MMRDDLPDGVRTVLFEEPGKCPGLDAQGIQNDTVKVEKNGAYHAFQEPARAVIRLVAASISMRMRVARA